MMRAWNVSALPTTFVLDADLHLRYRAVGDVAWDAPEADRLLAGLIAISHPLLRLKPRRHPPARLSPCRSRHRPAWRPAR